MANQAGHGRRGQDAILADQQPSDTVRRTYLDNQLGGLFAEVATVTADNQRAADQCRTVRVENALDEILRVVGLQKDFNLRPDCV